MPPAESGELLNRKPSYYLSWSTPILSPTRSRGREGTVGYTSSWASAKEVICTESSRSRKGSFCLRVKWWSGLFRSLWLCRYCSDSQTHSIPLAPREEGGWQAYFRKKFPQVHAKNVFFWKSIYEVDPVALVLALECFWMGDIHIEVDMDFMSNWRGSQCSISLLFIGKSILRALSWQREKNNHVCYQLVSYVISPRWLG